MTGPERRPGREDFLVFGAPAIGDDEIDEVVASLRSGWLGTGPKVARFEERLRAPTSGRRTPSPSTRAPRPSTSSMLALRRAARATRSSRRR